MGHGGATADLFRLVPIGQFEFILEFFFFSIDHDHKYLLLQIANHNNSTYSVDIGCGECYLIWTQYFLSTKLNFKKVLKIPNFERK